jgi:hypothetical protein
MATTASQTAAANQARRKRTEDKLRTVAEAIQQMHRRRLPVTCPAIAARAGVSRTFLYDNPSARDLISTAITRAGGQRQQDIADRDAQAEASWQQRALNAEQALKTAYAEIRAQRARIGELLGQLRDTHHEHDSDTIGRLSAENATLRQRIRGLTAGQRTLEERLLAARSNNRFLDKRIADSKRSCWLQSREPDAGQPLPRQAPDAPPPGGGPGCGARSASGAGLAMINERMLLALIERSGGPRSANSAKSRSTTSASNLRSGARPPGPGWRDAIAFGRSRLGARGASALPAFGSSAPYMVQRAWVGDIRAARRAGSRPAIAPMTSAAASPPVHAKVGMTVVQCLVWA